MINIPSESGGEIGSGSEIGTVSWIYRWELIRIPLPML